MWGFWLLYAVTYLLAGSLLAGAYLSETENCPRPERHMTTGFILFFWLPLVVVLLPFIAREYFRGR